MIREIKHTDLPDLLNLYSQLHNNSILGDSKNIKEIWQTILNNTMQHIIVAEINGKIVSSCVCTIIPNLTHSQRPYAILENIITDISYRNQGFATACLNYAKNLAINENCYKLMLLTGSKRETTLSFYKNAGYNDIDKIGFVQWI